ncbi:hypothetical protein JRO89_XS03G0073600 [Xanthoceras sorbifolium]|uniref:Uncharacterized protein n=1 Tax=Xanthoceras sorbifolium TaxID=99658 RepID=A0ABQ8IA06_9ROSI|nr:hypothetical protein JRO89_XS03G0073600 [Xanthoceras sorbifolium]
MGNYDILYIIGIVLLAVGEAGMRPLLDEFLVDQLRKHESDTNTNDDGVEDGAEADVEDPAEDQVDDDGVEDRADNRAEARKSVRCIIAWVCSVVTTFITTSFFFQNYPVEMPPQLPFFSASFFSKLWKLTTLIASTQNPQVRNYSSSSFRNFLSLLQGSGIKGLEEFMIGELPNSLKNYALVMNGFVIDGIGNFLGILFVYANR